jgi:anti-sigma B factor antagonist
MTRFNFDLQVERNGGRARVAVRGELDLGTAGRLERCLAELLERREPVLLDLRELTFMDSTGLCALLKAREQAQAHDWALAMVRPRGQALTTLRQSGAERLLPFEEVTG